MDRIRLEGGPLYSAAYIMPCPAFGETGKHRNHLRLLETMMLSDAPARVAQADSLEAVFQVLRGYKSLGDFLAFQFAIDLNYSTITDFSEMDFVVAGPGAVSGLRKCFRDWAGLSAAELIEVVGELSEVEFARQVSRFDRCTAGRYS